MNPVIEKLRELRSDYATGERAVRQTVPPEIQGFNGAPLDILRMVNQVWLKGMIEGLEWVQTKATSAAKKKGYRSLFATKKTGGTNGK